MPGSSGAVTDDKLYTLMNDLRYAEKLVIMLRPVAKGVPVRSFVDASYGMHVNGRSHTGICVVIVARGAVHCTSIKQQIVAKSRKKRVVGHWATSVFTIRTTVLSIYVIKTDLYSNFKGN